MISAATCEPMGKLYPIPLEDNSLSRIAPPFVPHNYSLHESPIYSGKSENSYYLLPIKEIESLQETYFFINQEKVWKFLLDNNDLIPVLYDAPFHIQQFFGSNMSLSLELHEDPEEDWDELFIIIKSHYDAEKALSLEESMFDEWFVDVMDKVQGRLNITEEAYEF